jgi:hypothetical protein
VNELGADRRDRRWQMTKNTHKSIKEFNKYVKLNWEGLKACRKSCNDLMINLFKGYQNAGDREFIRYIKQK